MATSPDGGGYWLVGSDGGVFSFGDARFHGSASTLHLRAPIVSITTDCQTGGYWLAAADGGVFAFDAPFKGSAAGLVGLHVVGLASTPSGNGYWLASSNGRLIPFGDAGTSGGVFSDGLTTTVGITSAAP
jgi:hypothetical protein